MLTGADSADYHVADYDGGDDTGDYACDGGDGGYGIVVRPCYGGSVVVPQD